jgi:hypothetical protein
MKTFLLTLFGWPGGILVGNLIASVVWVPLQWLGIHLHLKSHLREIAVLLDDCPNCGHRRSEADLLPSMTASSIVVASKNTEP